MADEYVIVEKSSLDSIGDTVRSVTGSTDSIAVSALSNEVATAVANGGGLPSGASSYQQLVTDGNGNIKWEDRLAYEGDPVMTEILSETTITFEEMDGGIYVFGTDSEVIPSQGAVCIVNFNGIEYDCVIKELYDTICTGNLGIFGEEDTGEPFTIMWYDDNSLEIVTNVALENTVSISAEGSGIIKLNEKFLPFSLDTINNHINNSSIHLSADNKNKWNNSIVISEKVARISYSSNTSYHSIVYGNGKFVATTFASDIASYSTDGINWTQTTLPIVDNWMSVTYGNDKFVTVSSSGNIAYSTNGVVWVLATATSVQNRWNSVIYGDNKFVAVSKGNPDNNYDANGAYSTDGINWTLTSMPFASTWYSVTYGDGKFVAVSGHGIAAYSTDGINWTQTTLPIFVDKGASNMSLAYGDGMFVVAGYGYNGSNGGSLTESSAAYSTDGINWTQASLPASGMWADAAYGADKFVIVGRTGAPIIYSNDGITWSETTNPDARTYSVTYAANKFVAVGDNGYIKWSNDGVVWENSTNRLCTVSGTDVTSQVKEILGF